MVMKVNKIIFTVNILFFIVFFSCQKPVSEKKYADVIEMSKDISKSIHFISQSDFKKLLEKKIHINILDCRESEYYDSACIPGAVNVPRGILEFKITDKIQERRKTLYIYSDMEEKSIFAAAALKKIKYSDVVVIKGNWNIWVSSYPETVEKEPNKNNNSNPPPPKKEEGGCEG